MWRNFSRPTGKMKAGFFCSSKFLMQSASFFFTHARERLFCMIAKTIYFPVKKYLNSKGVNPTYLHVRKRTAYVFSSFEQVWTTGPNSAELAR